MKKINVFKNYFLAATCVVLFAGSFAHAQQTEGKGATTLAPTTSTQNVKVVNTSAEPVPVAVSGTPTVQVGNTAVNPALMRDVDRSSRQPYHATLSAPFNIGGDVAGSSSSLVVPAGKRLVIKYVSAIADVPVGQVVIGKFYTGNPAFYYGVVLNRQSSGNGSDEVYISAQPVEIWLDPGDPIDIVFVRDSTLGIGYASVTFSGYLENVP